MLLGIIVIAGIGIVNSKPTLEGKKLGPCADANDPMDCLHGILMHGDDNVGTNHKAEDQYLRFKSFLSTEEKDFGPKNAEETYHAELMHGGEDSKNLHHDHSEMLPKGRPEKIGPEDLGEYMHGVLMHGDEEPGHDHSQEHKSRKRKDNEKNQEKIKPVDARQMMHGELMHGDANADLDHIHETKGDSDKSSGPVEPEDPTEKVHDLMHNGEKVDHSKETVKHPKDTSKKSGPTPDDLHGVLMHGDSDIGHNHEKEHAANKIEPFKFNIDEIKKIVPEDILKTVNLKEIMKVDKEDYKKWKDEKKKLKEGYEGSSFPFVMDTILSNIELMKKRYRASDNEKKGETEDADDLLKKNLQFTADVVNNLDLSNMDHEDDDMQHELELIGSTEPISERHKHKHFNMRNSKERHEM